LSSLLIDVGCCFPRLKKGFATPRSIEQLLKKVNLEQHQKLIVIIHHFN
jgi:hypothetical protein